MNGYQLSVCSKGLLSGLVVSWLVIGLMDPPSAIGQGGGYEPAPTFQATNFLPPEMRSGVGFKLKEEVWLQGMHYSFELWTRLGWYHPQSLDMLRIRLAEIRALETLTALQQDPLFLEGVDLQAKGTTDAPINSVRRTFKDPAAIPLGLAKVSRQRQAQEGNTPPDDQTLTIHEKAKRELAGSLGIDPYSDNGPLLSALNDVATNKNLGALAARLGSDPIPGVGTALSAANIDKGLQLRLVNLSALELRRETNKTLATLGVPQLEVDKFLRNPGYTPTRQAAIASAMKGLAGVSGIQNYIRTVQEAPTPEVALFYQKRIQLAERFHQSVRPLATMKVVGTTPVFLDQMGTLVVTVPVDYSYWNVSLASRIAEVKARFAKAPCEIFISGTASSVCKQKLTEQGIALHEQWGGE